MKIEALNIELGDGDFQFLKENACEACKGAFCMDESQCYEDCKGFHIEVLQLKLGIEDCRMPAASVDQDALLENLKKQWAEGLVVR